MLITTFDFNLLYLLTALVESLVPRIFDFFIFLHGGDRRLSIAKVSLGVKVSMQKKYAAVKAN